MRWLKAIQRYMNCILISKTFDINIIINYHKKVLISLIINETSMLRIRLSRVGKKNKAQFRVTVAEARRTPTGRFIEILGHYDPHTKEKAFNRERIEHWISKGAKPSATMNNFLVDAGIIKGEKVTSWKPKKKEEEKKEDKNNSVPSEQKAEKKQVEEKEKKENSGKEKATEQKTENKQKEEKTEKK